jgi:peptidoglycan/xylan/chitin deacetylase (PgdA/CDA1 family)
MPGTRGCVIKKYLIKMVFSIAYYSGIIKLFYLFNRRPIVITYHNIIADELSDNACHLSLTHKASVFEKQIAFLKRNFSIGMGLEPGHILITFDDGYKNNTEVALPIMERHAVCATFFIPACYFESSEMLWVDKILLWLSHVPSGTYQIVSELITIDNGASREKAFETVWAGLVSDYSTKQQILEDMEKAFCFSRLEIEEAFFKQRFEPLNRKDIDHLIKTGNQVACHSYGHEILSKLSNFDLDLEFKKCADYKSLYNSDWFGYPFGRPDEVSDRVVKKCIASGYSRAFVNVTGNSSDPFLIPRLNMPDTDDEILIHARLSGFEALLRKLAAANFSNSD